MNVDDGALFTAWMEPWKLPSKTSSACRSCAQPGNAPGSKRGRKSAGTPPKGEMYSLSQSGGAKSGAHDGDTGDAG